MRVGQAILKFVNDVLGEPSQVPTSKKPENPAQQLSFVEILRDFFYTPAPQAVLAVDGGTALRNRTKRYREPTRQLPLPFFHVAMSNSDIPSSSSISDRKQRLTASFDEWREHLTRFAGPEFQVARNDVTHFVQFITKTLVQMGELAESDKSAGTRYLPDDFLNQIFQPIMTSSLVFMRNSGIIPVQDETKILPAELHHLAKSLLALGQSLNQEGFNSWIKRYNAALGEYAIEREVKKIFIAP